jgi:protein required for attachment to host cells
MSELQPVEIAISLEKVSFIIVKAREFDAKVQPGGTPMTSAVETLRTNEWLFVLDGRKMLAFQNIGPRDQPSLVLRLERQSKAERTRDLGTDRPGRVHASVGPAISAVEATDLHGMAERDFVIEVTDGFAKLVNDGSVRSAVVVAPPRAIATFRSAAPREVRAVVRGEIVADLTKVPVAELERRFTPTP